MLFHHILSALYAIIFSSAMSVYSGVLASPLPLPLAFMTPGYGRLVSTRNSSAIWQGDANHGSTAAPHHLDGSTNKGHSLHRRGENYVYVVLKTYNAATLSGLKFLEQPYLYNAVEFRDSVRDLPQLIEGLKQQEQENEWLRVLECTNYFVKIVLKRTEEIIASVDIDGELGSVFYEIKCLLEDILNATVNVTGTILDKALPHFSLLDGTLDLVWKTTCNLDDILARYV